VFLAFYNTGARVSEVVAIKVGDVDLGRQPGVRVRGKGRKERAVPLWKPTAALLTDWLRDTRRDLDAPPSVRCPGIARHVASEPAVTSSRNPASRPTGIRTPLAGQSHMPYVLLVSAVVARE
jgi:integrase